MEPVSSRGTVADGLDVPAAIMGHGILRAIQASEGGVVRLFERAITPKTRWIILNSPSNHAQGREIAGDIRRQPGHV